MVLTAYYLGDRHEVPPIMIDVPDGGGYDFVKRKLVEGLQDYCGENETIVICKASMLSCSPSRCLLRVVCWFYPRCKHH